MRRLVGVRWGTRWYHHDDAVASRRVGENAKSWRLSSHRRNATGVVGSGTSPLSVAQSMTIALRSSAFHPYRAGCARAAADPAGVWVACLPSRT